MQKQKKNPLVAGTFFFKESEKEKEKEKEKKMKKKKKKKKKRNRKEKRKKKKERGKGGKWGKEKKRSAEAFFLKPRAKRSAPISREATLRRTFS